MRALAIAAATVLAASAPAAAQGAFDPKTDRETHLLSRSLSGGFPNGPSRNGVFSQDRQLATLAAYESNASDIVAGDSNGVTDVFLVRRARPYDLDGPPWKAAGTALVSRGRGGQPANGPSYKPDIDGEQLHHPHCVAFVSAASNLVRGDTNGQPDAFVKDLRSGRIRRVSVNSRGRQAAGATNEVKVDGNCQRVAFVADAPNLALTKTRRKAWRNARTSRPTRGVRQVYVRILSRAGDNAGLKALTFLASASRGRKAGNGSSYDLAFARGGGGCPQRCGDFSGESIVFTSRATNLTPGDSSSSPDVYKRSFTRKFIRHYPRIKGVGRLRLRTKLLSATPAGRAGNGPSSHPAVNDNGFYVAFETEASDLLPGDSNAVSDIARVDTRWRHPSASWVSKSAAIGQPGNGASRDPAITRPGSPVFYESEATNLQPRRSSGAGFSDRNGVQDIFFWNVVSRNASLQSRDSDNAILNLPQAYSAARPPALSAPSKNPAASYYGNYLLFETAHPLVDLPVASKAFPGLERRPGEAARLARSDAALNQVYLRYIGPR